MLTKDGPGADAGQDNRDWDRSEVIGRETESADRIDPENEDAAQVVAVDEDIDELDVPIDPDFIEAEGWVADDIESDLDLDLELADDDDENDEDDREIQLLQELGIDLDAPDVVVISALTLALDQDDAADDGLAA